MQSPKNQSAQQLLQNAVVAACNSHNADLFAIFLGIRSPISRYMPSVLHEILRQRWGWLLQLLMLFRNKLLPVLVLTHSSWLAFHNVHA